MSIKKIARHGKCNAMMLLQYF